MIASIGLAFSSVDGGSNSSWAEWIKEPIRDPVTSASGNIHIR
jgi:hypothetical protein